MFLLFSLMELDVLVLKEEVCMFNIESLANVGRCKATSSQNGSWWQSVAWCVQQSQGFAEANVPVLPPRFLFVRC